MKKIKVLTHKDLRKRGWVTLDEFLTMFNHALKQYLETCSIENDSKLHHPEDIMCNVLAYAEAAYATINTFGTEGDLTQM